MNFMFNFEIDPSLTARSSGGGFRVLTWNVLAQGKKMQSLSFQ